MTNHITEMPFDRNRIAECDYIVMVIDNLHEDSYIEFVYRQWHIITDLFKGSIDRIDYEQELMFKVIELPYGEEIELPHDKKKCRVFAWCKGWAA